MTTIGEILFDDLFQCHLNILEPALEMSPVIPRQDRIRDFVFLGGLV